MQSTRKNLIGMSREELALEIAAMGEKPFRAKQLWHWIYHYGVKSFDDMANISKEFRQKLSENYSLERPNISIHRKSLDGTQKFLLKFEDGNEVETVFIPDEERGTLCVSSQVGCSLTCKFCHTGTQVMVRNLTSYDIVGQFMAVKDALGDWPSSPTKIISNIVMMGMGEPLLNYDNVAKALKIYLDPEGLSMSKRKITLSTSGIVPMMQKCGDELGVSLAVSLHAVNDELRNEIVPINKKYPIAELMEACRTYPAAGTSRRITFEYVMLKDVNDSDEDARQLAELIRGIPAIINLIPFNPWPGAVYQRSSNNRIHEFSRILRDSGFSAPIRTPRGEDILAACGQLKSESQRKRKSEMAA